MKRIITVLLLFVVFQSYGQDDFLEYEEVFQKAQEESKLVLLVFSGSDWCKPCIQLKKEILETEHFQQKSKEFVYLYVDFPYKKNKQTKAVVKRNERLAEQYNRRGKFPLVVLIDNEGQELGVVSYISNMTTSDFIQKLAKLTSYD